MVNNINITIKHSSLHHASCKVYPRKGAFLSSCIFLAEENTLSGPAEDASSHLTKMGPDCLSYLFLESRCLYLIQLELEPQEQTFRLAPRRHLSKERCLLSWVCLRTIKSFDSVGVLDKCDDYEKSPTIQRNRLDMRDHCNGRQEANSSTRLFSPLIKQ